MNWDELKLQALAKRYEVDPEMRLEVVDLNNPNPAMGQSEIPFKETGRREKGAEDGPY